MMTGEIAYAKEFVCIQLIFPLQVVFATKVKAYLPANLLFVEVNADSWRPRSMSVFFDLVSHPLTNSFALKIFSSSALLSFTRLYSCGVIFTLLASSDEL